MGKEWYGYVYKKNHTRLSVPKLVVPSLANKSSFAPDLKGEYYFAGSGGGGGGGYGIVLNINVSISYYYLLGILNSKISTFFLKNISTTFRGGYMALNRQYIEKIPIRTIDFDNPDDIANHDEMVGLVEKMLKLHETLTITKVPSEKEKVQRQIDATDKQIDSLVYELYGLTDEEIEIIDRITR